ncbi:MAG TPA: aldolase/citrate lyase family protein [Chloroflexota bacterium]
MPRLVRRSVLIVPVLDEQASGHSWRHNADAIALDLDVIVDDSQKRQARSRLPEAIATARRGGAEVFARITRDVAYADIVAAAIPGLTGILLPGAETAADVAEVDEILQERERIEGIPGGKLEIFLLVSSAKGVWNVRQLLRASPRISAAALDEPALCASLGIVPRDDFDALTFSRGRLIVESLAVTCLPVGIGHPLGARPRELPEKEFVQRAGEARNTGFKGALCPFPSWVEACNRAFTPSDEQIAYYREVRKAFAEGVARGTAAVPFPGGQMLDVPVDERAKLAIDLWERSQRRDREKAAALAAAGS